jgi:curli biogenesis system outer membrane secretion channel CsgG
MKIAIVLAGVALAALPAAAQQRKSVAVEPFEYSAVRSQAQAIFGTQMDVGRGISALLVKRITDQGRFTVVERQRVNTILKEQDFGASGRVKKGTQARIGQIRGADFTLMGDIVTFGRDDTRKGGGAGAVVHGTGGAAGLYRSTGKAVVILNFRMVDSETSEVVMTGEARGESKRSSTGGMASLFVGGVGGGAAADFSSRNFGETIIGEATIDACDKLATQIAGKSGSVQSSRSTEVEGLVAAVEGGQVYLNVGSSSGVQVGDVFQIEHVVREVRDPATKEVLDVVTQPLGTLTVSQVREKISIGAFSGATLPKPGDRVIKK